MSTIPSNYDDIFLSAHFSLSTLGNKNFKQIENLGCSKYEDFLCSRIFNPTLADTAMQHAYDKHPDRVKLFKQNAASLLERSPKIDYLTTKSNLHYAELYPKTGNLREKLIKNHRINYNYFDIPKKMTFLEKLKFLFK